eukprot:GHRR01023172.1.p1 GENE.GHRR01023172.1~~GHRR01023172.1.p1  ORF type:complete len:224 (+),score=68.71 GHRR01023172.1:185-856(+)
MPQHTEHAKLARWLVHLNSWGSLSTTSPQATAGGGTVSYADGAEDNASGRLFFYLTPMDETAQHIQEHPTCAFIISEAQMLPSGCDHRDPEDPTCARITILGRMEQIESQTDKQAATAALFSRHPVMQGWPDDHGFQFYELHVQEIHILDWYGGMHILPADEYFAAGLEPADMTIRKRQWRQSALHRAIGSKAMAAFTHHLQGTTGQQLLNRSPLRNKLVKQQ